MARRDQSRRRQHNNLFRAKRFLGISKLLCQPILSQGLVQKAQSGQDFDLTVQEAMTSLQSERVAKAAAKEG